MIWTPTGHLTPQNFWLSRMCQTSRSPPVQTRPPQLHWHLPWVHRYRPEHHLSGHDIGCCQNKPPWYLQPTRPPAAQLLYDLGLKANDSHPMITPIHEPTPPWPSMAPKTTPPDKWVTPVDPLNHLLPLRVTGKPITAQAAAIAATPSRAMTASELVTHFLIGSHDMATIYMSPDPYHNSFEEELDLRKYGYAKHHTAGLSLIESNNRLLLATMSPHTPGSRLPCWRSNLRGAWLVKINNKEISTIKDAQLIFQHLHDTGAKQCTLLFAHPEIN